MVATGIAKPRKEKTDEIVPQIIEVIHAASRIIPVKI